MDEGNTLLHEIKVYAPKNHVGGATKRLLLRCATTITRLHAEIEALKSDVSDLVRAGSDEATENERLREALRPFAVWAQKMPDVVPEFGHDIANILAQAAVNGHLTGEHFRAASRTLADST